MSWIQALAWLGKTLSRPLRLRILQSVRTQTPKGFVFLADQRSLNREEYRIIARVQEWTRTLIRRREAYLREQGLDSAVHFPKGIWQLEGGEGLYVGFRHICEGDAATLHCLRLYCQHFTGFRLASMKLESVEGKPFPSREEVQRLDDHFATIAATPDFSVERYQRTVERLPPELHITPPRVFGEIGWLVGDKIINWDTCVYQERMALLHESGVLRQLQERQQARGNNVQPLRIIEIGGGYGGLAYHLKKYLPGVQYFIVDIPESLIFSSIYLSVLFKEEKNVCLHCEAEPRSLQQQQPGFTFVPNFLFDKVAGSGIQFDLALNTLSMSEMAPEQVHYYCQGIKKLLAPDGVFFEQNQDNRHLGKLDARTLITEHFSHKVELDSKLVPGLTQGRAHLWSTNPITFAAPSARAA